MKAFFGIRGVTSTLESRRATDSSHSHSTESTLDRADSAESPDRQRKLKEYIFTNGNNGTGLNNIHETPLQMCICETDIQY